MPCSCCEGISLEVFKTETMDMLGVAETQLKRYEDIKEMQLAVGSRKNHMEVLYKIKMYEHDVKYFLNLYNLNKVEAEKWNEKALAVSNLLMDYHSKNSTEGEYLDVCDMLKHHFTSRTAGLEILDSVLYRLKGRCPQQDIESDGGSYIETDSDSDSDSGDEIGVLAWTFPNPIKGVHFVDKDNNVYNQESILVGKLNEGAFKNGVKLQF